MSLKTKLYLLVIVPTVLCTAYVVYFLYTNQYRYIRPQQGLNIYEVILFATLIQLVIGVICATLIANSVIGPLAALLKFVENPKNIDDTKTNRGATEIRKFSASFKTLQQKQKELLIKQQQNILELESKWKANTNELTIQKEATFKVLKEIDEEKKISQTRAQELQKFQLAVDEASDHIVISDADGYVLYTNKACQNITGFSANEIIGTKAGKLWGGQMDTAFYQKMWETIAVKKAKFNSDITNRKKDGTRYTAEITISPILSNEGRVVFFVSIERDITQAKEIDRMKTDFISLVSHQLRTPLVAIRWGLETLIEQTLGKLSSKQLEYAKDAHESTLRMTALVNDLLNISRIESGRLIIEPKLTSVMNLVTSVVTELDSEIKLKNQKIEYEMGTNLPEISIDPKLIRNVILNLVSNAVKYTGDNKNIKIGTYIEGENLITFVKDSGIGIPTDARNHIFDRFFRADNVHKISASGTGLGLYLAKTVVQASNGSIWFESEEDKGSTFFMSLPLAGVSAKKGEVSLEN